MDSRIISRLLDLYPGFNFYHPTAPSNNTLNTKISTLKPTTKLSG